MLSSMKEGFWRSKSGLMVLYRKEALSNMQMKCKKGIWIGTILNHFLSITARSEYSCIEMNISAQIIQKTLFLDLHYFDAEGFFTRLELWLHSYAKQSHKYDFDWFDYLIQRTHNDDSRQNVSKSNYANYQNFEFHFYWLVLCEKKLWDEKKTFNRIKIGNEKKLTEKKFSQKKSKKNISNFIQ